MQAQRGGGDSYLGGLPGGGHYQQAEERRYGEVLTGRGNRPCKDLGVLGRGLEEEERGGGGREGYQEDAPGYLLKGIDFIHGEPWEVFEQGHDLVGFILFLEFALVALTGGGRLKRER